MDDTVVGWFAGRIPDGWFSGPVEIVGDRDELIVTGTLRAPDVGSAGATAQREAERSRMESFREDTRPRRMEIAAAAETRFGRKVSWSVRCGESQQRFTHLAAPAMTRLRLPERRVLDTLVDAGVARSRSDALQWCVKLVGRHESEWLSDLRQVLEEVETVRERGPASDA